jgi:hypothetical protein
MRVELGKMAWPIAADNEIDACECGRQRLAMGLVRGIVRFFRRAAIALVTQPHHTTAPIVLATHFST